MKNRLAEILRTGRAPGVNTKAGDPHVPAQAVPRAFKDLEQTVPASKIARDSGFSVRQIKRIWNMGAILVAMLALTAGAADLTRSITFTDGSRLTAAQLHTLIDGASINTAFYSGKSLLTAVDSSDYILLYDVSAGTYKRMTLSTLVLGNTDLITTQPVKPNLAPGDFFLLYDAAGGTLSKVSYTNLLSGNTNLIGQLPPVTTLTDEALIMVRHGGTNNQMAVSNLWLGLVIRAGITNLAQHLAPTNTDRLLIWDSAGGTNKTTTLTGVVTNLPLAVNPLLTSQISLIETGEVKKISLDALQLRFATNGNFLTTNLAFVTTNFPLAGWTGATNCQNAAHGLTTTPRQVRAVIYCTSTDLGYAVNDEVEAASLRESSGSVEYQVSSVWANSTNVGGNLAYISGTPQIPTKTGAAYSGLTKSKWSYRIYCYP